MRSITLCDMTKSRTELPEWARYAVVYVPPLAYPATRPDVTQAFGSRVAAERWAMACARALPPGSATEIGFVLVYALGPVPAPGRHGRNPLRTFQNECAIAYRAIDSGGHVVKDHKVPSGYGVTQSRETRAAA